MLSSRIRTHLSSREQFPETYGEPKVVKKLLVQNLQTPAYNIATDDDYQPEEQPVLSKTHFTARSSNHDTTRTNH